MKSLNVPFRTMIWGFFCALFLMFAAKAATAYGAEPAAIQAGGSGAMEFAPGQASDGNGVTNIDLYATAAVLMDADTGRVLFGKNEDTPMAMASTTKILTCILVLENASLEETVSVSAYAASMPKVKLYMNKGERYTVGDLLYSLMLESHNDSAVALAEHVGHKLLDGGLAEKPVEEYTVEESRQAVSAFVRLMNEKAVELGCENSWFITPNGLDATQEFTLQDGTVIQKEHCTTAAELARIMSYCIGGSPESETFLKITRTGNHSFSANGRSFSCVNHNAFLNMMDGALSGKTGFTNKAGYCYVGSLRRDDRTFVVALLACGWPNNKSYKWSDTRKLMQYGVDNYFYRSFLEEETAFDESLLRPIPVENGQTAVLGETAYVRIAIAEGDAGEKKEETEIKKPETGMPESGKADASNPGTGTSENRKTAERDIEGLLLREDEEIRVEYSWEKTLTAPVQSGMKIGTVTYSVNGEVYRTEEIVTADEVAAVDFAWCAREILDRFLPGRK